MTDPFLQHLGLARRAGQVLAGQDRFLDRFRREPCYLIVMTTDAGAAARRKIGGLAERHGIPLLAWYDRNTLGSALGLDRCTVVGLTDKGFAENLIRKIPAGSKVTGIPEE